MFQTHYIEDQVLLCGLVLNRPRPVPVQGLETGDPCSK